MNDQKDTQHVDSERRSIPKWVLRLAIAVIVIMALFPPWTGTDIRGTAKKPFIIEEHAGYAFILNPPKSGKGRFYGVRFDTTQLLVQVGLVVLVAGGFVLLGRRS